MIAPFQFFIALFLCATDVPVETERHTPQASGSPDKK
jgi:hypothetical protein